jgi:hypothetical protein
MRFRRVLLSSTFLSGLACGLIASSVAVADTPIFAPRFDGLPAVDGINGKAELVGGSFARKGLLGAAGSVAAPLGGQYGVQFDGSLGSFASRFIASGAGHLFWRNPAQGLLGLYGDHTHWNRYGGVHVSHFGAEGEAYFGRWTLYGVAGVEFGNNSATISSSSISFPSNGNTATVVTTSGALDDVTRFFDRLTLSYYVTDNWKASIGHRYLGGRHALTLGTEYAMPTGRRGTMGALFAEARIGEGSANHGLWGGARFYFGNSDKSLIRRHREDDPVGGDIASSVTESLREIADSLGPTTSTGTCAGTGEVYLNGACVGAPD